MIRGLFEISISGLAESLDVTRLDEHIRETLFNGAGMYDPDSHDLYRFFVVPRLLFGSADDPRLLSRREKRKSFHVADTVLIQTEPASPRIQLLGIYPTTTTVAGQSSFDFDGDAILELSLPGAKFKVSGRVKNTIRSTKKHMVLASRTNEVAQWIFLKPYLVGADDFCLQFLCTVPKAVSTEQRAVSCDVQVAQGGRQIAVRRRKIHLP